MKNEINLIKPLSASSSYFSISLVTLYSLSNLIFHVMSIFEKYGSFGIVTLIFSYFLSALIFIPLTFVYFSSVTSIVYYLIIEKKFKFDKLILILIMVGGSTIIPHILIEFTKKYGIKMEEYYLLYIICWFCSYKSSIIFYNRLSDNHIPDLLQSELPTKIDKNNFF